LANVRRIIKRHKQLPAGKLIAKLNPILRGWAYYRRHVVSKATFQRMDSAIFHCLWRWAKRRHPQKGVRWVKKRYYHAVGQQQWRFYGEVKRRHQGMRTIALQRLGEVTIKRHVKIQGMQTPMTRPGKNIMIVDAGSHGIGGHAGNPSSGSGEHRKGPARSATRTSRRKPVGTSIIAVTAFTAAAIIPPTSLCSTPIVTDRCIAKG
jgi:hypothetical protein